ncbi:hypothetical protein HZ326_29171 [Fusarium oxysporum f. sp. albedinis]|nr:hypothetical protein HZ326_29171 [Fusarium oxysporum f. sp. albedinis]
MVVSLQHTGWPPLFHNLPLAVIAATARKPNPAWNEDYLDESRDCDDGDRDENNYEDEEGYSNDYEGPEAGNRSNENDKYHDVDNGEDAVNVDSAFSLPSGLWLHLSEAIFQLSRMFCT